MPENVTINPVQYTHGLYNIAAQISVSGHGNVKNLALLLDGLNILKQVLEQNARPAESEKKEE